MPRLNGSHAASNSSAAIARTRTVAESAGSAARSTPRVNTNQVATASRVLGSRSHSGARLRAVSGASRCWLAENGTSAAFHQR